MTPQVRRAVRVTARAEERASLALLVYKDARRRFLRGNYDLTWYGTPERARRARRAYFMDAYAARVQWSTLTCLLASESDIQAVAV